MPKKTTNTLSTASPEAFPITVAAIGDPGDETQRNFRYQHAYGVILLVAGAVGTHPYEAIWCEHHEDLLAERVDNTYDAYQVKTRRPELGAWKLTDDAISHSIGRFVQLEGLFGGLINTFVIVSNTEFATCRLDIKDVEELKRSPIRVLEAIHASAGHQVLTAPFSESITRLAKVCSCTPEKLYEVLKRTQLVKGPSKEGFDTDVAHLHLPQMAACRQMVPAALNSLRDELIQKVYGASSLQIENPLEHLYLTAGSTHPRIMAKRVDVAIVGECLCSTPQKLDSQSGLA